MKKLLFLLGALSVVSTVTYSEVNLWESENFIGTSMGYTGFEIAGKYYNRSIKNVNEDQRFLNEVYAVKRTINENLKEKAMADTQEKNWILNADVDYLKYEDLSTSIYNLSYAVLSDVTRYGINVSMFDGDTEIESKEYDSKGYQVNLFFNRNEDLGNLFGTLYIGKNEKNLDGLDIDNLYYGYFTSLEQKYESFDLDEFYSGYFLNLDISRTEADYKPLDVKKVSKDNDSIDSELGILFEKKMTVGMDNEVSVKLTSSIGKEFKEEDKYKDLGKDEFEFYNRNRLEITTNIGTGANIFAGAEYRKSLTTSNSDKNLYIGFRINF